jgi:hypothetical protein
VLPVVLNPEKCGALMIIALILMASSFTDLINVGNLGGCVSTTFISSVVAEQ